MGRLTIRLTEPNTLRASWPEERIIRGTLADIEAKLAAEPAERTALIFVGKGLGAADFVESQLYNADYVRRFRPGWPQAGDKDSE